MWDQAGRNAEPKGLVRLGGANYNKGVVVIHGNQE